MPDDRSIHPLLAHCGRFVQIQVIASKSSTLRQGALLLPLPAPHLLLISLPPGPRYAIILLRILSRGAAHEEKG